MSGRWSLRCSLRACREADLSGGGSGVAACRLQWSTRLSARLAGRNASMLTLPSLNALNALVRTPAGTGGSPASRCPLPPTQGLRRARVRRRLSGRSPQLGSVAPRGEVCGTIQCSSCQVRRRPATRPGLADPRLRGGRRAVLALGCDSSRLLHGQEGAMVGTRGPDKMYGTALLRTSSWASAEPTSSRAGKVTTSSAPVPTRQPWSMATSKVSSTCLVARGTT
jgi:hypothetical protein